MTPKKNKPEIVWRSKQNKGARDGSGRPPFFSAIEPLLVPSAVADVDWQPPKAYKAESTKNVISFWLKTCQEASGRRPVYNVYSMQREAEMLIASLGYVRTLQVLAWMATPLSKYFQYPYTLNVVQQGHAELAAIQKGGEPHDHSGFIGPVGLTNLLEEGKHESQRAVKSQSRKL